MSVTDETPQWYAANVKSRHEKKVATRFEAMGVRHWLPLLERRSRWSDRYVTVTEPLFPGYVFVNQLPYEHDCVNHTPGVVKMVGFGAMPVAIPPHQIEAVRHALEGGLRCDPYPLLKAGKQVIIKNGPLKHHQGMLVRRNGRCRVLLSIPLIGQSVSVEVPAADVEVL